MSWNTAPTHGCPDDLGLDAIETVIIPRARDIGGFEMRRARPTDHEDRSPHITQDSVSIAGQSFEAGQMMVFRPGDAITLQAGDQGARLMAPDGATMNGPRHIWWNFVASSRERIKEAKREWREARWGQGRFDLPAGDRDKFIPLP